MALRKSAPAPLVVCLSTGVLKVKGTVYHFHDGERLRQDHPLVAAFPSMFAADGLTSAELAALRQRYQNARRIVAA